MLSFKEYLKEDNDKEIEYEEHLTNSHINWLHQPLDEDTTTNSPFHILTPSDVNSKIKDAETRSPSIPLGKLGAIIRDEMDKMEKETPEERKKAAEIAKEIRRQPISGTEKSNPKLEKSGIYGEKLGKGAYTIGVSLAPADMSGVDVCPCRTASCTDSCLGKESGRAVMGPVRTGRIDRTKVLLDQPRIFIRKLVSEIHAALRKAQKENKQLYVRLNVLSDIAWEYVSPKLFNMFPDVQFYDYTKVTGRIDNPNLPKNYELVVSSTGFGEDSNWKACKKQLDKGGVVSMVFRMEDPKQPFEYPAYVEDKDGKKYKVVNGDEHDLRPLDKEINDIPHEEGVIAGLKLKGGLAKQTVRAGSFAVAIPSQKDSDGKLFVKVP